MLFCGAEDWNPTATAWLEQYQINLDAGILVAKDTGERGAPAWHHNLQELMLWASCGLKVSETVLTESRNPKGS